MKTEFNFNSQQINVPLGAMFRVADFIETTELKVIVCGRWGAVDEITLDVEFNEANSEEFKQLEIIVEEWFADNEDDNESEDVSEYTYEERKRNLKQHQENKK